MQIEAQAEFDSHSHWFTESSLAQSSRVGECLVCSNLTHCERQAILSFLGEGMMSPRSRSAFLKGNGFCARHFWMAKGIEENEWPARALGAAILCENLVTIAIEKLPSTKDLSRRPALGPFRHKPTVNVRRGGWGCVFCQEWDKREESLIEILQYLKHKPAWSEKIARSPLCVRHGLMALQVWKNPSDKLQLREELGEQLRQLQADLKEFIRKRDWNYRNELVGREQDAVFRAIQFLIGPARQFPVQKAGAEGRRNNGTRNR